MSDQYVRVAPDSSGKKVATQQVTRGADDVQIQEISVTTRAGDDAMDEANNALRVNVVAGSAGGPSKVDDAAFAVASDSVAPIGALADETGPDAVDEGDVGVVRMTLNRALHVTVRDAAGDSCMDESNNAVKVNVVAGSAGATEYVEDAAAPSDPQGGPLMARRRDTPTTETTTDGDITALNATAKGELYVKQLDPMTIADGGGIISVDDGAGSLTVDGTVAVTQGTAASLKSEVAGAAKGATAAAPTTVSAAGADHNALDVMLRDETGAGMSLQTEAANWDASKPGIPIMGRDSVTSPNKARAINVDENGTVQVDLVAGLPPGTNNIGDVDIVSLPALPTGGNNIGDVDIASVPAPLNVTGGGVQSPALRVTIADDSTGTVKATQATAASLKAMVTVMDGAGDSAMDDANNALRVNIVAGGAGDGAILDGASGSIRATVRDYTNSNPLAVVLTDTNGDYVGAGAGTQYAEDSAHASGDMMTMAGVVQQTSDAGLAANGDRTLLQVDDNGFLKVNVKAGSSAGAQYTEDAASATNPVGNQIMGRRRDTPASEVDADGDVVALNATAKGELYVKHADGLTIGTLPALPAGTNNIGDVDVLTLPPIPAGSNNIGDVDVLTLPALPAGTNNIGDVDVLTLPAGSVAAATAKTADFDTDAGTDTVVISGIAVPAVGGAVVVGGDATNGLDVDVTRLPALPTGANKIGAVDTDADATLGSAIPSFGLLVAGSDGTNARALKTDTGGELQVDVLTLPALAAGSANIGDVDVLTLPPLVAGSAKIGAVDTDADATPGSAVPATALFVAGTDGTNARGLLTDTGGRLQVDVTDILVELPAGTNNIGDVDVLSLPALPAGTNNIGDVDVLSLPALAAGTNNIGDVDIASIAAGTNNIGDVDIVTMPNVTLAAGTNTNEVVGDVAHDVGAAGNPLMVAGVAETPDDSAPANQVSAEGDATRIATDRDGAVYTHPHPPRIWHVATEYTSQQTDATVKAAPGTGLSLYVTDIYIACNAAVTVTLEEGTTTLKWRYYGNSQGQGCVANLRVPIKIAANTALTVTTSGAVTCTVVVNGYTAP